MHCLEGRRSHRAKNVDMLDTYRFWLTIASPSSTYNQPHHIHIHIQLQNERLFHSSNCYEIYIHRPLCRKDFAETSKHAATWIRQTSFFSPPPAGRHTTPCRRRWSRRNTTLSSITIDNYVSTAKIESHVLTSCAMVANESKGHVWCFLMYENSIMPM